MNTLIGIMSCQLNAQRRQWCRELWTPGTGYFFAAGGETTEPDVLRTRGLDDYAHLTQKIWEMFRYAVGLPGWDLFFKCDDDTYVDIGRLMTVCPATDMLGCSGGGGYMLRRSMVERLVTTDVPALALEDKAVALSVVQLGGTVESCGLFNQFTQFPISPVITGHGFNTQELIDRVKQSKANTTANVVPAIAAPCSGCGGHNAISAVAQARSPEALEQALIDA